MARTRQTARMPTVSELMERQGLTEGKKPSPSSLPREGVELSDEGARGTEGEKGDSLGSESPPSREKGRCSSSGSDFNPATGSDQSESSEEGSTASESAESSGRARGGAAGRAVGVEAEGTVFPGAPARSDPGDGPSTHFPNPRLIAGFKRSELERKYQLPAGYRFVFPEADATVNKPPHGALPCTELRWITGFGFPCRA